MQWSRAIYKKQLWKNQRIKYDKKYEIAKKKLQEWNAS